jgi:hypothetical protein
LAVDLVPQPLDLQLQGGDDRLGVRNLRHRPLSFGGRLEGLCLRLVGARLGHREGSAQGFDVGRYGAVHGAE